MLTKTTLSALRALACLGAEPETGRAPLSPRQIADRIGESPTYLAKVMRLLARAGILRAQRGVHGGGVLHRRPCDISLLAIVEACQGAVLGRFCDGKATLRQACAFHHAAAELHDAIVQVLSRWTLQDFVDRPGPSPALQGEVRCWMQTNPWRQLAAPLAAPRRGSGGKRRASRAGKTSLKRAGR